MTGQFLKPFVIIIAVIALMLTNMNTMNHFTRNVLIFTASITD